MSGLNVADLSNADIRPLQLVNRSPEIKKHLTLSRSSTLEFPVSFPTSECIILSTFANTLEMTAAFEYNILKADVGFFFNVLLKRLICMVLLLQAETQI